MSEIHDPMRLLVAPRDAYDVLQLRRALAGQGHETATANDGREALAQAAGGAFAAIVVLTPLPDMSLAELVAAVHHLPTPIPIVVYGRNDVATRVQFFNVGADECIVPPVDPEELTARLRAVVRRGTAAPGAWLRFSDLEMHLISRTVRVNGRVLPLTPREFTLLEQLLRHCDQIAGRALLYERVWGSSTYEKDNNVVEVYVSRLRRKLRASAGQVGIRTVPRRGYTLTDDPIPSVTGWKYRELAAISMGS